MKLKAAIASNIFCLLFVVCIFIFFASAQPQEGKGYPASVDSYVNDFANVLTEQHADGIHKLFKSVRQQTGIEAVVVTVHSIEEYQAADTTIESFATNLFNEWGVGNKEENNGVLILVAVKDRKCRIELGGGYANRYDSDMKQVIDKQMIPLFKADEYSKALYEGAQGVIEQLTREVSWFSFYKWHLVTGILGFICICAGISCLLSGKKGWGWALFAMAGGLFLFLGYLSRGVAKEIAESSSDGGSFGGGSSFGGGASGSW